MADKVKLFHVRIYRCEWQVVTWSVDQYGKRECDPKVMNRWPTREEAMKDISNYGVWRGDLQRWLPHDGDGYKVLDVIYKEVHMDGAGEVFTEGPDA